MFGSLGWQELLIILAILVVLFGASRVGDLGAGLGRGIREFRKEARLPDGEKEGDEAKSSDEGSSTKA